MTSTLMPMRYLFSTLLAAFLFSTACAHTVEKSGYKIVVPDGWRSAVGTCTGEIQFILGAKTEQPRVILGIGRCRYLPKDHEYHSTGDRYDVSSFAELEVAMAKVSDSS